METPAKCSECGTLWTDGQTCTEHFYQMLYWENEYPGHGIVHNLMVLCYNLQHPSIYSPETLESSKDMLRDFIERDVSVAQMRKTMKDKVDSGKRKHKITGTPERHGEYAHPVTWTMTAADVVKAGADAYIESVREWARQTLAGLRVSGNYK
jgi:hypothetical protein